MKNTKKTMELSIRKFSDEKLHINTEGKTSKNLVKNIKNSTKRNNEYNIKFGVDKRDNSKRKNG